MDRQHYPAVGLSNTSLYWKIISVLVVLLWLGTGCDMFTAEEDEISAHVLTCEGCHTDKTLLQTLAESEVEEPEGGG